MTDVVVAPTLGGSLVGCMLLLTGTVVVTAPTRLLMGCVLQLTGAVLIGTVSVVVIVPTVLGEVVSSGIDAMDRNTQYSTLQHKIQNRNV